jgi:hypothetical protein
MARIIKTGDTPAKRRNAHIRSVAEVLRLMATRPYFNEETQDMTAFLVYCLRGIYETIEESVRAWEDRNYWQKAEGLRNKWRWSHLAADELEAMILADRWDQVQEFLITLIPHFQDVNINQLTRDADWWCGALNALRRARQKG